MKVAAYCSYIQVSPGRYWITTGINSKQSFGSVFEDADDGIESVRRKLDTKARFARQYSAIRTLLDAGLDTDQIATLLQGDIDLGYSSDLAAVSPRDGAVRVIAPREPLAEYLEKARETGLVINATDRLFADRKGNPLDPGTVESVLRDSRLAASNIEGQATICASLHESRYDIELY